jgi:NAD(P)-dependent dehydrogenase (short-subunit alcohol dehydrogenase family)
METSTAHPSAAPGRLNNQVAIVTGAGCVGPGWGNGRAVAVLFAQAGAKIFAVDKSMEAMEETVRRVREAGGTITAHTCDVTDSTAVEAMVAACKAEYGRVDILVNNVGGSAAGGPVALSEDKWDAQVAYAACKAGVIQLGKVVAVEYAKKGIRVNTVVPGQLHTPMVEVRLAGQRSGGNVDKLLESRLARIPLGFMGDGRDTANAALFLASDEAQFITGTEIIVDGGMTARCD